jgi:hypothetical protein
MQYQQGGDVQHLLGVFVPLELQSIIQSGDVIGLHIETLEVNSIAPRLLKGGPSYVVLGVRRRNGEECVQIPKVFIAGRWRRRVSAAVAGLIGAWLVTATPLAWLGALLLVVGTHTFRSSNEIPTRPFQVYKTRC